MPTNLTSNGTRMWCPHCKTLTHCRVISTLERNRIGDLHVLQHDRECTVCDRDFTTIEIDRTFVDELFELRLLKGRLDNLRAAFQELLK